MKNFNSKNLWKILTLVLSVVLIVTALVVVVSADDGMVAEAFSIDDSGNETSLGRFATVAEAVKTADDHNKSVVKILKDTTWTIVDNYYMPARGFRLAANKDLSIDLGGHHLTVADKQEDGTIATGRFVFTNPGAKFAFIGDGDLTFDVNGSILESNSNWGRFAIEGTTGIINVSYVKAFNMDMNTAENVIRNAKITYPATSDKSFVQVGGPFTVDNVEIVTSGNYHPFRIGGGTTTITNSKIIDHATGEGATHPQLFSVYTGAALNMKNVEITSTERSDKVLIFLQDNSNLDLVNVKISAPKLTNAVFSRANGTAGAVSFKYCSFEKLSGELILLSSAAYPATLDIANTFFDVASGTARWYNTAAQPVLTVTDSYLPDVIKSITDNKVINHSNNTTWGTETVVTANGNTYSQWKGAGSSATAAELRLHYGRTNADAALYFKNNQLAVFSVDISATDGKFMQNSIVFSIFADGIKDNSGICNISTSGLVTPSTNFNATNKVYPGDISSYQIAENSWATLTTVVDMTDDNLIEYYVFIDGKFLCRGTQGWNSSWADTTEEQFKEEAIVYGYRVNPSTNANGLQSTDRDLLFDNSWVRTFAPDKDASGNPEHLTEGKARFYAKAEGLNLLVEGRPVVDIDSALEASTLGLNAELVGDLSYVTTVTKEGTLKVNGHSLVIANDSTSSPKLLENGDYEFKTAYNLKVTHNFYIGTPGVATELEDPAKWQTVDIVVGADPLAAASGITVPNYTFVGKDRIYYLNVPCSGWTTGTDHLAAPNVSVITYEYAQAHQGEAAISIVPAYEGSAAYKTTKAAIVLDANGKFLRVVDNEASLVMWSNTQRNTNTQLKDGETLVLQANITIKGAFGSGSGNCFAGGTGATYGFDLNGFTLTCDPSMQQAQAQSGGGWFNLANGNLNLYSSRPGGKIEAYGVKMNDKHSNIGTLSVIPTGASATASGGVYSVTLNNASTYTLENGESWTYNNYLELLGGNASGVYFSYDEDTEMLHRVTMTEPDASGNFTLKEEYKQIKKEQSSAGSIFYLSKNANVNVGDVTVGDVTYSGANLTMSASALVFATDITGGTVNISGTTFVRNGSDAAGNGPGVFVYNGGAGVQINVTNSLIVLTGDNRLIYGNATAEGSDGAKISISESIILVKNDGASILDQCATAFKAEVSLTNVTTNASLEKNTYRVAILGENVTYVNTAGGAEVQDGIVADAIYSGEMDLGEGVEYIVAPYVTPIITNVLFNDAANAVKYNVTNYYFVLSSANTEGLDGIVHTIPTLNRKATAAENTATLTYNDFDGNAYLTETYVKGTAPLGTVVNITAKELTYIKLTHNGSFDALPAAVTEDVAVNPGYNTEVLVSATGTKINVSVYDSFNVNIYVPKDIVDNGILDVTVADMAGATAETEIDGVMYYQYTVTRQAEQATLGVPVTFAVTEAGYSATTESEVSVYKYAKAVLENGQQSALGKDLMVYMLTYANAANAVYAGAANADITATIESSKVTTTHSYTDNVVADVSLEGVSISFITDQGNIALVISGAESVVFAGRTYTGATIKIENLKVYNFADDFQINGATYNCANTVANALADETYKETPEAALLEAFYEYAMAARAYKDAQTATPAT